MTRRGRDDEQLDSRELRVKLTVNDAIAGILSACGNDTQKLRSMWQRFVDSHQGCTSCRAGCVVVIAVAKALQQRLNQLEGNMPGLERGTEQEGAP